MWVQHLIGRATIWRTLWEIYHNYVFMSVHMHTAISSFNFQQLSEFFYSMVCTLFIHYGDASGWWFANLLFIHFRREREGRRSSANKSNSLYTGELRGWDQTVSLAWLIWDVPQLSYFETCWVLQNEAACVLLHHSYRRIEIVVQRTASTIWYKNKKNRNCDVVLA